MKSKKKAVANEGIATLSALIVFFSDLSKLQAYFQHLESSPAIVSM